MTDRTAIQRMPLEDQEKKLMNSDRPTRRLRRLLTERGATALEMAFLLSLVMVPLISAVEMVQDNGGSRLGDDGDRIGTPREGYYYTPGTQTGGNPPSTLPPPSTVATVATANLATLATPSGTKWTATVVITVLDPGGNPIAGANVQGSWTAHNGAQENTTCSTDSAGRCTVTQWGLKATGASQVTSTTYAIVDITGDGFTLDPTVVGTSATVNNPTAP